MTQMQDRWSHTSSNRTGFSGRGTLLAALFFSAILFAAGYSCLARAPQNPDGAELVMAALQGAVLHPPGYPLQGWLGKMLPLIGSREPAWSYSLICLLIQCLAAFCFTMATREYGLRPLASLATAALLFYFPPIFMLGVQPEKYALVLLFAALLLMRRFWFISGLAITQHFGLLALMPIVLWRYHHEMSRRGKWLIFAGCFFGGIVTAQLSLLLLARFGGWPDWGALRSWGDVMHHTLRSDLGFFGGTKGTDTELSALRLLIVQWPWLCAFWSAALIPAAMRVRTDRNILPLLASLFLGLAALGFATLPGKSLLELEYLSRYWAVALPPLALLIGLGLQHASAPQKGLPMAALLASLIALVLHRQQVDLSHARTYDVYRSALSRSISTLLSPRAGNAALYVSNSDLEPFWGLKLEDGSTRFPIAGDFPWFLEHKAHLIEPRLREWGNGAPPSTAAIMAKASEKGVSVVTTTPGNLPVLAEWKDHGLFFSSASASGPATARELGRVAQNVCTAIAEYGQSPPELYRYGSIDLWEKVRRPFLLLGDQLEGEGRPQSAEMARQIFLALEPGSKSSVLTLCQALQRDHLAW